VATDVTRAAAAVLVGVIAWMSAWPFGADRSTHRGREE